MKTFTAAIIVWFMAIASGFAQIQEPKLPRVDQQFSIQKEKRIDELEHSDMQAVFEALKSPGFFDEEEYLNKAIYRAFNHRAEEVIEFVMGAVRSTRSASENEGARDLYLAKRILQIFPERSMDRLLDLYSSAGPKIRANVIYVVGQMVGGQVPGDLLSEALYDTSICQEVTAETLGEPLRICDVAYNQLVIRYSLDNVLRAIGTGHSIDVRDYHIRALQARF
jgi:hypothetical protein